MSVVSTIKALSELFGKQASDADVRRIHAVAHAIGCSDNDAFLSLIAALDQYYGLYQSMPDAIVNATRQASAAARETAEAEMASLAAETRRDLAAAVNKAAAKSAAAASTRTMVAWIASAIVICGIVVSGIGYLAYNMGRTTGWEAGVTDARNEELFLKKRDEFTTTKAFSLAYNSYLNGELVDILKCKKRGWSIENGICYPGSYEENGKRYFDGFTAQ